MLFSEPPTDASMGILLGLMAAAAVLIFVALTLGRPWIVVVTAMICAALSAYSLQQGGWPIAAIEAVWVVVLRKARPPVRRIWTRRF